MRFDLLSATATPRGIAPRPAATRRHPLAGRTSAPGRDRGRPRRVCRHAPARAHDRAHSSRRGPWATALALTVLLGLPAQAAGTPEVSASLAPGKIGVEDLAQLVIELRGESLGRLSAQPAFLLDNLEIAAGPSRSESFQFVNGATSRSLTMVWRLRPLAPGVGRVTNLAVVVDGQAIRMQDQQLEIVPGSLAPPPSAAQDPFAGLFDRRADPFGDPFANANRRRQAQARPEREPKVLLRAEVDTERPWQGQQVTYTVALYTQTDIAAVEPKGVPSFRGLWAEEVPVPENPRAEMVEIGGDRYGRVVLYRRALFPLAAGPLEIEPFRVQLSLRMTEQGLFGPMFGQVVSLQRSTDAIRLDVQPLPPAPPGFTGAVGEIALAARLEPAAIAVGEAATLSLELTGRGNLQGLAEPTLPVLAGVRIFPPHESSSSEVVGGQLRGRRAWSYVLVPERPGSWELPPIRVDYFDPRSGQFAAATTRAFALAARAAATVAGGAGPAAADGQTSSTRAGSEPAGTAAATAGGGGPFGLSSAPARVALGSAVAVVGLALVWVGRRSWQRLRHPAPSQALAATLASAGRETRPRQAAALIEQSWRDYLEARWQIPQGTPSTRWAELLQARGVDGQAAGELVSLADELHYLRYAPQLASAEALQRDVLERSERLRRRLR